MQWKVTQSKLKGSINIPPSKSHTIRALACATLADGESIIRYPLLEGDGHSALKAVSSLGGTVTVENDRVKVKGLSGNYNRGDDIIDFGNSGTSTRVFSSIIALGNRERTVDGDHSLRKRPMRPLLDALRSMGAHYAVQTESGDMPFTLHGPIQAGVVSVSGITSQYVTSLLLAAPLLLNDSVIKVEKLHEKPYVNITLYWLDKMGIHFKASPQLDLFEIKGNQRYSSFDCTIPGDFSGATFSVTVVWLSAYHYMRYCKSGVGAKRESRTFF